MSIGTAARGVILARPVSFNSPSSVHAGGRGRGRGATAMSRARARLSELFALLERLLLRLCLVVVCGVGAALGSPEAARATEDDRPIVTVLIGDRTVSLGFQDLAALPQVSHVIDTPWTEPGQDFAGPLLTDILDHVGARAQERIIVTALNAYEASIPVDDLETLPVILAIHRNGAPMSVRENGPAWIIYPLQQADLRTESVYAKMVWHVTTIDVQ